MEKQKLTPEKLYEREKRVAENIDYSIVDLLKGLRINSSSEKRAGIWEKFFDKVKAENPEISDADKKYERTAKQNIALLTYIRTHIEHGELLDPRTLEFRSVDTSKLQAGVEAKKKREKVKAEIVKPESPPAPKAETPKPPPAPTPRVTQQTKEPPSPTPPPLAERAKTPPQKAETKAPVYENQKEILKEVTQRIERFYTANRNRPYDTSVSGNDGASKGRFAAQGQAKVLDNITGKTCSVDRDPSKASRVKDAFGREKVLSGEPAVCTDVIMDYLVSAGIRAPGANRSCTVFDAYAKAHPESYSVFSQNIEYPGLGKELRLTVPCQIGDVLTFHKKNGKRHIMLVTQTSNGKPTEVMDSSATNMGLGKRPFLHVDPGKTITDFKGGVRTLAVFGPELFITNIIRPHYKMDARNMT